MSLVNLHKTIVRLKVNAVNKTKKNTNKKISKELQISPIKLIIIIILVAISTYFITRITEPMQGTVMDNEILPASANSQYSIKRLKGFKYIQPLLSAKPIEEYDGYSAIKKTTLNIINAFVDSGIVSSVSVYFRDFDKSNWFCIDDKTNYMPGSLMKIPGLMTLLKMEEHTPGFLNKRVFYVSKVKEDRVAHIISSSLPINKNYSLRELTSHMIIFSDNEAALLLTRELDNGILTKIFTDLGLREPKKEDLFYPINVKEASLFLETIFNASYLNLNSSEYALDLLSKTVYKEGIVKGIGNSEVKIAHKFAEAGTEQNRELHETAILYINRNPYLLTIMTRGKTNIPLSKLEEVIQAVARQVYSGILPIEAKNQNK